MAQKIPSLKTIHFLKSGYFYFYKDGNEIWPESLLPSNTLVNLWRVEFGKLNASQQAQYEPKYKTNLLIITGTDDVQQAAVTLKNWEILYAKGQEKDIRKTVPENMDQLLADLEERNEAIDESIRNSKINVADLPKQEINLFAGLEQAEIRARKQRQIDSLKDTKVYLVDTQAESAIKMSESSSKELDELILLAKNNPEELVRVILAKITASLENGKIDDLKERGIFEFIRRSNAGVLGSIGFSKKLLEGIGDQLGGAGLGSVSAATSKGELKPTKMMSTAQIISSMASPQNQRAIRSIIGEERYLEISEELNSLTLSTSNLIKLQEVFYQFTQNEALAEIHHVMLPPQERFVVTTNPDEATHSIDLGQFLEIGQEVSGFDPQTYALRQIGERYPQVINIASKLGFNIETSLLSTGTTGAAVAEGAAVAATDSAITALGVGAVEGAAAATTVTAEAGLLAAPEPVVTKVLAAIVALGSLALKAIKKISPRLASWISTQLSKLKKKGVLLPVLVGGSMATTGLIIGSPLLLAAGGASIILPLAGVSGGAVSAGATAGVAGIIGAFYLGVKTVLSPIFKGFVGAMIALVFFTALVYFIIQAGAYVIPVSENGWAGVPGVPEGYGSNAEISPYIAVTKIATSDNPSRPPAPFQSYENSDLPVVVQYGVTVRAKKSALSNLTFKLSCSSVSNSGSSTTCPPIEFVGENNPLENPPAVVSVQEPYSFTYTMNFDGSQWEDTLITDTWTVTAVADETTSKSSGSASVAFGNPPASCPNGWPIGPEGNEPNLRITQGPGGIHRGAESIDIGASIGHTITARHSGTAQVLDTGSLDYGKHVIISSLCATGSGTIEFRSVYAHMSAISIAPGPVGFGQVIGYSGNTGGVSGDGSPGSGAHLHYEFKGLPMRTNYIPKNITRGCYGANDCDETIP